MANYDPLHTLEGGCYLHTLSLCYTPETQYLLEGRVYMSLVPQFLHLVSQFLWLLLRGCLLITWLCGQRSLHSWVPQDCNMEKELFVSYHQQAKCRLRTKEYFQSFYERSPFALFGSLVWGAGFWFSTHLEAYWGVLRNESQWTSPLPLSQLTGISQKGTYTHVWHSNFLQLPPRA